MKQRIHTTNPATGELIREYESLDLTATEALAEATRTSAETWRRWSLVERGRCLREAAKLLRKNKQRYARLMAEEMGKPLRQGASEAEKCAWVCDYYAEKAAEFLTPQAIGTDAKRSYVSFQPLGVVLAIMPFNFPFWQVFRAAAPGLMAGNGMLLKHASSVAGCGRSIEELLLEAGLPRNTFTNLITGREQAEQLISHPAVSAVTLTGSTGAGRAIAARSGAALKKCVLELGGSDPYVVLQDAKLEETIATCVESRLINGGQSCIAAKRFIVHKDLKSEFEATMVRAMQEKRVGDPLQEATDVGPMARMDLRDALHAQVVRSIEAGAKLLLGGKIPDRNGAWYPPTVLTDVRPQMPAFEEELFGPVAAIIEAHDDEDAIRLANDSTFGLGAAVFTRDTERGEAIARERLQAGSCFVNTLVRSDPRLPFGGIKESGFGRELSVYGIHEFVNIKTVYIA